MFTIYINMHKRMLKMKYIEIQNISRRLKTIVGTVALVAVGQVYASNQLITNVSYDPTRELYTAYNAAFAKHWKEKTGNALTVQQSHGGSGKQARAVIDGLDADVVTLALAGDVDAIAQSKIISEDWQKHLEYNSAPYTSTIVFVVRKGNPKGIKDWNDLVKPGISVITPNPKTSGGARWNYLAAWGYILKKELGDLEKLKSAPDSEEVKKAQIKAHEFIEALYKNVPVLDSGARGSTVTFAQRGLGDVFLSWENEAFLVKKEFGADKFDTIAPSISILAEPSVSIVDKVVDKHGTRKVAEEYLKYLYSPEGQEIAAKNFYRPRLADVAKKYEANFQKLELFTIDDVFGGWKKAQTEHFSDKGIFDQIYKPTK